LWLVGWLGRAVTQADQDAAYDNGGETETDPYALQWPESAPLTGADKVHSDGGDDHEQAERDDGKAKLTFSYHHYAL